MTKLIIRDDDLSYFADSEIIEYFYKGIWDRFPIYFSTIPNVYSKQREVPINENHPRDFYKVGDNKELVDYLKTKIKDGKIKIWQHGFTHKNIKKGYELENIDSDLLYKNLKEGKNYLEKLFNISIDTLVAPHDRFSKEAILTAEKIGYKYICRGFAPLPREIQWNSEYLNNYFKLAKYYLSNSMKSRYPNILELGGHKEIFSYRLESLTKNNIPEIVHKHKDKVLCITNHYRSLSINKIELLKILIENINN